eukprot:5622096-Pyramimonas_sp.AAC.1
MGRVHGNGPTLGRFVEVWGQRRVVFRSSVGSFTLIHGGQGGERKMVTSLAPRSPVQLLHPRAAQRSALAPHFQTI